MALARLPKLPCPKCGHQMRDPRSPTCRRCQNRGHRQIIGLLILAALVIGLLGCSVAWTRLPDPRPGVSRYEVTVTRGAGAGPTEGGLRK